MSQYLLSLYRPVADELLVRHKLSLPNNTRDMLATTIMHSRELAKEGKDGSHSPTPARKKVETHARALLGYSINPPVRKDSILKRCASLEKALLSSGLLALDIGISNHRNKVDFDFGGLLESLKVGNADPAAISILLDSLSRIPWGRWEKLGRPKEHAGHVVRSGCLAWKRAGRTERYSWREDKGDPSDRTAAGVLEGPL